MSSIKGYGTVEYADSIQVGEVKKPSYREPHTMNPRTWLRDLTPYFLHLLFVSTIGPLLFGYHLAELNTPGAVLTCKKKSIFEPDTVEPTLPQCIPMNDTELGLVTSIFTLGGLLGALAAGPVSARRGRLRTMQFTTFFFILGPVFEALAPSIAVMSIGRFISGLGAGASVVVVPIYVSEISPPAERGFFGSWTQIMVNGGIFVTQILGYFFSYGQKWRLVLGVGGAIGLFQALALFTTTESPKWLADNGKVRQARSILQRIRGDKFDIEDEVQSWGAISNEDHEDEEAGLLADGDGQPLNRTASGKGKKQIVGMWEAATHPDYRKAVFAVVMIMIAQQMTGINSIIMYGVDLLADLLKSNSAALNLGVSLLNIIVTAVCAPLVDKLGRKTCLIGSISGMGVGSLLLAFSIRNSISVLSAIAVLIFVASFGFGLGPIPFILASELVSTEAVNATQSWALAANWISTFIVAQFFPLVNNALGKGMVYFGFAAIAAFFATFVASFVPETKGKRDADEVWGRVTYNERSD